MGRWTPLILMAGGLAILLGTLLGINFPMGGQQQTANNPPTDKKAKVLPANINVNSTAGSRGNEAASEQTENRPSVASQNTESQRSVAQNVPSDDSTSSDSTSNTDSQVTDTQSNDANQSAEPIRALW